MEVADARAMLAGGIPAGNRPVVWADLGAGEGTFTRALAELLPDGSVIHAVDSSERMLRRIPARHAQATIVPHRRDFTALPWPFDAPGGLLIANALHYVEDQLAFLTASRLQLDDNGTVLIVEYDTTKANPWVPFPVDRHTLSRLLHRAGYSQVVPLATRPSLYRRDPLYSVAASR